MNDLEFYNGFRFMLYEFSNEQTKIFRDIPYHFFAFVYEGEGRFVSGNDSFTVSQGDFFYLPKGLTYTSSWHGAQGVRFASLGFSCFPRMESIRYPMQKIPATPLAQTLVTRLMQHPYVSCLSVGLLYELADCMLPQMKYLPGSKYVVLVDTAERYWMENPFASAKETAHYCSISESRLYHAFRVVRGCTLVEAKHKLLVNAAVGLLKHTDKSIEEISGQLGFSSATYFRKVFKAQTGASPREIRRVGLETPGGRKNKEN